MSDDNWVRLDDRKLRNAMKSGPDAEARTYGLDGKIWPRVCVSIRRDVLCGNGGYLVSASRKAGPGVRWYDCGIPAEALRDLPELIKNVLERATSEGNAR